MVRTHLLAALVVLAAPLSACAHEPSGYANGMVASGYGAAPAAAAPASDGLLPEPPENAKAGECFAKVVVPGQPVYGPPAPAHARWVQTPPRPGTIGPVWCIVWERGYQPTVTFTPERYGWIRVICDKDATRETITRIQRRLHDHGVYQGGFDGRYDAATAEAVTRFQGARHIEHGGYLSYQTMEALEAPPVPVRAPRPMLQPGYGYAQGYGAPVYRQPAGQPCGQPACQPVYQPQPCGQPACAGPWGQQAVPGKRLLTWAGKTAY